MTTQQQRADREREWLAFLSGELDREPDWFRESVQRAWRVGDRVRVLVAGECDVAETFPWSKGHDPAEVGLTGVIVPMPRGYRDEKWAPSHPYAVRYDGGGAILHGRHRWGGAFAACELEPEQQRPAAARPAGGEGGDREREGVGSGQSAEPRDFAGGVRTNSDLRVLPTVGHRPVFARPALQHRSGRGVAGRGADAAGVGVADLGAEERRVRVHVR